MRRAACDMIGSARRAGARVISAGPDVTDAPESYLKAGADLALIGEGLSALWQVLPKLDACPNATAADLADGVAGIALLHGGKALPHGTAHGLGVVAEVGLAAWDLVDMERYDPMAEGAWLLQLNTAASRGALPLCLVRQADRGNQFLRNATEVAKRWPLKRSFHPDHIWFLRTTS
jgi:anaerobic magnesium-protoporphyrin IX monomethyl ester cyclase